MLYSYADKEIAMHHALLIDCAKISHLSHFLTYLASKRSGCADSNCSAALLDVIPPTHSAENPITTKYGVYGTDQRCTNFPRNNI